MGIGATCNSGQEGGAVVGGRRTNRCDAPCMHDSDPVGETQKLWQVIADHQDGNAVGAQFVQAVVEVRLGSDVDTDRRLV